MSSVTNDRLCYKLLKSLLLIGYQQICHWFLSFVIEKRLCETGPWLFHVRSSSPSKAGVDDESMPRAPLQHGASLTKCKFSFDEEHLLIAPEWNDLLLKLRSFNELVWYVYLFEAGKSKRLIWPVLCKGGFLWDRFAVPKCVYSK